ncbi:MAG: DNA-processing protein DprA [Bacteroidales bacterium]|nr:DNA-processing protein DprA [Bacteroidales bacterium]
MDETLRYKIALSLIPGLNAVERRLLLDHFGSAEAVFSKERLNQANDLNPKIRKNILQGTALQKADEEIINIEKNHIQVCFINDDNYPKRLKACPDAPVIIYSKGLSDLNASKVLAIVGTRHATTYGKSLTEHLVRDLAQVFPDIIILSGLAYGIDICAHKAAIANNLNTVAVLGHGLQEIYPVMHRDIAAKMQCNGSLITELPWGTPSAGWRFIQRNRLVAGMSDACIVIESAEKGGSLITAQMTSDYGKDVFAFPGRPCDEYSRGCNLLIKKQIAGLIESAEDVITGMNWTTSQKNKQIQRCLFPDLNPPEERLYHCMTIGEKQSVNELAIQMETKIGETLSLLLQLEMAGLVEALPGGLYCKKEI